MTLRKPAMLAFDLDGTLVDSAPDIAHCIDETMLAMGLPLRGVDKVRQWMGNGAERLIKRALTDDMHGEPRVSEYVKALDCFLGLYASNTTGKSEIYPGVLEVLDYIALQGIRLCCITNKNAEFTLPLLKDIGLYKYFELVISGNDLSAKKPDPLPLLHAVDSMGILPESAWMIGDSSNDVEAARAAGFNIIAMSYGYNHGDDIRDSQPDVVIDSMLELRTLIQKAA